jgi:tRNA/rRNA methyltransferase
VLVRPRNPLNLAAAARAAMNFGFHDMVVVSPHPPVWEEAQASPGARRWLGQVRHVSDLAEAISDCHRVYGTSSLARRRPLEAWRVVPLENLRKVLARQGAARRVALLFGSEKRGLTNDDLSHCHAIVRIPTIPEVPSMNLGQAVAVCCYELSRPFRRKADSAATLPHVTVASMQEIARLIHTIEQLLPPTQQDQRRRRTQLRDIFLRWSPTSRDVALLLGVFRDLSWNIQALSSPCDLQPTRRER